MPYRNVVVGTDGSTTAERAVRHAGALAGAAGARLFVVTAYEPQGDAEANRAAAPADLRWMLTDRNLAEDVARGGREVAKEAGAARVAVESEPGDPAAVLIEAAERVGADLIVVGSHGLTSSAHFLLGSVASSVSHHAPCDVLIVHTT